MLGPILRVPPTRSWVRNPGASLTRNVDPLSPFSVGPIFNINDPPFPPFRIAIGG